MQWIDALPKIDNVRIALQRIVNPCRPIHRVQAVECSERTICHVLWKLDQRCWLCALLGFGCDYQRAGDWQSADRRRNPGSVLVAHRRRRSVLVRPLLWGQRCTGKTHGPRWCLSVPCGLPCRLRRQWRRWRAPEASARRSDRGRHWELRSKPWWRCCSRWTVLVICGRSDWRRQRRCAHPPSPRWRLNSKRRAHSRWAVLVVSTGRGRCLLLRRRKRRLTAPKRARPRCWADRRRCSGGG